METLLDDISQITPYHIAKFLDDAALYCNQNGDSESAMNIFGPKIAECIHGFGLRSSLVE